MKIVGVDVTWLGVNWTDENGRHHEEILSDVPTTYEGAHVEGCNGWIDFGKWHFSFDPDWKVTVLGRLSDDFGRVYFRDEV